MTELSSRYNPADVENKWLKIWRERNLFHAVSNPDKKPFTIVIPPPNVTGILHMGHALNNTLQDILIRYKRMNGYETLWMAGTDHAGIATQNVVEKQLAKEGKKRQDLGREEFLKRLWAWKEEYGSTILNQLEKLGSSCDWERVRFTMDPEYSDAVNEVFIRLYNKGLIYRGNRIINWCPRCQTALSDEEAEHQEKNGKLYHFKYPLKDNPDQCLVVATTRPETMLGDTAVAVHPTDERYIGLIGKTILLPLLNREIPVIADDYVAKEFGTGAVKVTPAHDPNDFQMGLRHNLPMINVMHPDGKMNPNAGVAFEGLDRFEARKRVVAALEAQNLVVKIEDHRHAVGHCYRCDTVVEPYLSKQWFVKMKPLAEPALKSVLDGHVKISPPRWEKVYINWMEGIRDWCISRQIWWGHQIPVWHKKVFLTEQNWTQELLAWGWDSYVTGKWSGPDNSRSVIRIIRSDGEEIDPQKDHLTPVVKSTEGEYDIYICTTSKEIGRQIEGHGFRQDPDVLDTWFSSWLWPFATLGWPKDNKDLKYFYPTDALFTASEILFFWVARMIMAGYEFMGDAPFKDVYIHGTVRDAKGRKMSKSLGNAIDPLEIINEYGADALRFSLIINSGQDIFISKEKFEIGRNFANKIWNASRLVLMNVRRDAINGVSTSIDMNKLDLPSRWILTQFYQTLGKVSESIEAFRYSEAESLIYEFFWGSYCDWYLEIIKGKWSDEEVQKTALFVLEQSLRMMHPFIPFVTEEVWGNMTSVETQNLASLPSLSTQPWPKVKTEYLDTNAHQAMNLVINVVTAIRNIRVQWNIKPNESIDCIVVPANAAEEEIVKENSESIQRLGKLAKVDVVRNGKAVKDAATGVIGQMTIYVPLGNVIDLAKEKLRIQAQIDQQSKICEGIDIRLNSDFAKKAPAEVVEKDRVRLRELRLEIEECRKVLANLS